MAGWPPWAALPAVSSLPRRPRSPSPAGPILLRVQGLWTAGQGFLETVVCAQAPGGSQFPHSFAAPSSGRWSVLPVALGLGARVDPAPAPCRMWRVLRPSGPGGVASASGGICAISLTSSPARLLQTLCEVATSSVPGPQGRWLHPVSALFCLSGVSLGGVLCCLSSSPPSTGAWPRRGAASDEACLIAGLCLSRLLYSRLMLEALVRPVTPGVLLWMLPLGGMGRSLAGASLWGSSAGHQCGPHPLSRRATAQLLGLGGSTGSSAARPPHCPPTRHRETPSLPHDQRPPHPHDQRETSSLLP